MKLYKFEDFVNEMVYCKLKNIGWYVFEKVIRQYAKDRTGIYDVLNRNDVEMYSNSSNKNFRGMYKRKFGKDPDILELYGMAYNIVTSPKGDKFVFKLDGRHEFHFYPMCDETKPVNAANYNKETKLVTNPRYCVFSVYAVDNGVAKKVDDTLNSYYLADICTNRYSNVEQSKLYKILDEYFNKWGINHEIEKRNKELDTMISELKEFTQKELEKERIEEEERAERERLEREAKKKVEDDRREQRGGGVDVTVTYKGKNVMSFNVPKSRVYESSFGNIRYLLSANFRMLLEEAMTSDIHPDVSGMTNLEKNSFRKPVYTERNLPKDHYTLYDYYRTYAGEFCEHCGKDPIVNVMIIENPEGERFHVGNECVKHLVDIPEEEFEDDWNAPFKLTGNIMNKVRSDKNRGFDFGWYVCGDKCYYVSSAKPLLECPFLDISYFNEVTPYLNNAPALKLMKREYSIREVDVDFMKRMLPRYYKNAIVLDFNIGDMYNMMFDTKAIKENFRKFTYNGVEYSIPVERVRYGSEFIKRTDYEFGEYSQKFTDLGMGDYNVEYTLGDTKLSYKWHSIPVE